MVDQVTPIKKVKSVKPGARRPTVPAVEVYDRAYAAHKLRLEGHPWREVAARTGFGSDQAAIVAVSSYLTKAAAEQDSSQRAERLQVELDRLDALQAAWWSRATGLRDGDGVLLLDEKAAAVVLQVMRHRAKLLGLEDPVRADTGSRTIVIAGGSEGYIAGLREAMGSASEVIETR